jgi:hypothetical protein
MPERFLVTMTTLTNREMLITLVKLLQATTTFVSEEWEVASQSFKAKASIRISQTAWPKARPIPPPTPPYCLSSKIVEMIYMEAAMKL